MFDTHCHLQDERLRPHLEAVLQRAAAAGVTALLCCGSAEADWAGVHDLAQRHPALLPAYGLHPWYVMERSPAWLDQLRARLETPAAAVGEIGLDHALDPSTFVAQEAVFLAQVHLAAERHRPVSLHCRRAWGRLMELLDHHGWPPDGIVLHSYSGGKDLVPALARRGAFFSFSGAITHDLNRRGRDAVAAVPADRLLIETDAPDIPAALPDGTPAFRDADGRVMSEPAHLVQVVATVAALRGLTPAEAAELTDRNARQVFRMPSV
jgi:TatD DNase family protein